MKKLHAFFLTCALVSLSLFGLVSPIQTNASTAESDLHTSISVDLKTKQVTVQKKPTIYSSQTVSPGYTGTGKTQPMQETSFVGFEKTVTTYSVIGKDNRTKVTNTKAYPYRAIAYIQLPKNFVCTGWFISPDTIVTAGHCLYNVSPKDGLSGWIPWAKIYPGRNGSSAPYGYANASHLYTVKGWTQDRDPRYDYGAIKLDRPLGNSVGWFGFRWQSASLTGIKENIAGYPAGKGQTMWQHKDQIRKTKARQLGYQNDTEGGQSGSPVYETYNSKCNGPCGIAIHAYGTGLFKDGHNYGTRITKDVFDNLMNWKK
ncbi:trypsin-like serine peptidase [Thermoflavimicrobium dichotomicum]|uniref:Serine protease n=1 Tax=Thermoflavimicrobium dichotomicum TaxID=46223 RepID=A0A1I3RBV8_9BACL|nr:serine protease [Thermoflavimicrobium dichotomicum]SFJ43292.1 glutamyl endopeptidase [Thermoflavimicrobium dichotomicum]